MGGVESHRLTLARRHPILARIALLGIGALAALVALVLVEVVFKLANDYRESRVQLAADEIVEFYLPLGYRLQANAEAHARKVVDGKVVFDTIYTTDDHHRRRTPDRPGATRAIAFLGDSFVFGEGVSNEATLPWQIADALPEAQVYNLGYSGYGPQQALALIPDDAFTDVAKHDELDAIYVFIPGHVRRAIGAMRMWLAWGRHFPCYDLVDGSLTLRGSFVNARPERSRFYDLLGKSQTLRYFKVDWPLRLSDDDFDRTARILAAARDALHERNAAASFRVLLFPDMPNNEFHPARMIPFLDAYDIPWVDLSDTIDMQTPGMIIPGDGHPTAAGYRAVADAFLPSLAR